MKGLNDFAVNRTGPSAYNANPSPSSSSLAADGPETAREEWGKIFPGGAALLSRIVIMHQGALGDFLLAFQALNGLYLRNPNVRMDFWSREVHVRLIASKPYVGQVHSCEGAELTPFFHEDMWRKAPVPPFFEDAHTLFVFGQASTRSLAHRLSRRLASPVHWVQSFPDPGDIQPVSRFLAEQLGCLGWPVEKAAARIEPSAHERSAAREWLAQQGWKSDEKPVLIHPGSGGRKKIWPLKNWWALLHWLREVHHGPILLTIGPADAYLQDFAAEARKLGMHVMEDLSLPRLNAFLAESLLYMGNDSGVSHLAGATGIPCVVMFGPTDPRVWAPAGPHVHVVQSRWEESEVLDWPPHAPPVNLDPDLLNLLERLTFPPLSRGGQGGF